jgi:hypothetical protein
MASAGEQRLELYKRAAAAGSLDTLRWLAGCAASLLLGGWRKDCGSYRAAEMCAAAAGGGQLAVLQWLWAEGCEWDEGTCGAAAEGGHLVVLQWARANGCEWGEETCSAAAEGGHLAVLQWARANGCTWRQADCLLMARAGSKTHEWIQAQPA